MKAVLAILPAFLAILGCTAQSTVTESAFTAPEASSETSHAIVAIAGRYGLRDSFEQASRLELLRDGTYRYFLSVGSLDLRSAGRWDIAGGQIRFTTLPEPVPPSVERLADDTSGDAPWLLLTRPDGRGVAFIDLIVRCADDTFASSYTLEDGWPYRGEVGDDGEGDGIGGDALCEDPQTVRFRQKSYGLETPSFEVSGVSGGLRFVLHANDAGVLDMTGWRALPTPSGLEMIGTEAEPFGREEFVRLPE